MLMLTAHSILNDFLRNTKTIEKPIFVQLLNLKMRKIQYYFRHA